MTEFVGEVAQVLVNTRREFGQARWLDRRLLVEHGADQFLGDGLGGVHFVSLKNG